MTIQQQMVEAMEQGDLNQIHALMEEFKLHVDPDMQYEVAGYLMNLGFIHEATSVLEHLQFLFPEENQIKVDRASLLMEINQEDEALDLFLSIPQDAEEYPQVLLALADYYQMQGLYEVAEKHMNEALELLPDEPLLHFAKAELLMEMGRLSEAARLYENLYKNQKEIAGVRLVERIAEVHRTGAAFEDAYYYYLEALKESTSPDLLFGAAYSAFQLEMYEAAARYGEDLRALDPDYFAGYLLLAQSYAMMEDNVKALEVIKEGIKRDEYDKELFLFAGKMAIKNKLPEEAEAFLRQAIALDPEYMEAVHTLVSILSSEERDEEVVELIEGLSKDDFEWTALSIFAALAYDRLEMYEEAYTHYRQAFEDYKEDVDFLEKYVYFLIEDGKRQEALQIVALLRGLQPEEPQWIDLQASFDA
ncbi:tetratricopeptide repeat protein [Kurthia gibsonii]|uniref:tetratricopeptide repeat protein n=1 Tax=Kurthia gibsonii TaxID=33946 RepID=UPI001141AF3B|nr:tetratricopeptide repeat protein [Kurthia gibsonii]GED18498.1 TPR repeat-containing protein YpiA [Kurthia gibsonii]